MHVAIISQQGRKPAGAEHALMQFIDRLPPSVEVSWFFLEDGEFASAIRSKFSSVTIVSMSRRIASAERAALPLGALFDGFEVVVRLTRALRRSNADVVLTNSMKAHVIGSLAAKLSRIPCVNYIHDIVEGKALALLRFVSRLCAVERLTCSEAVKAQVRLARTSVAYAAIDVASFAALPDRDEARRSLGLPGDAPIVGLVGRIARWKGQDRFVRIAVRVAARRNAHFCIVGSPIFGCDDAYVEELRSEVARLGLQSRISLVPWQETMQRVYAAIDVACNCSAREPFGRTSLEALASGVRIVCFDDAGICEVFEQNRGGIHVPSGDEEAFAAAVVDQLDAVSVAGSDSIEARDAASGVDVRRAYEGFIATLERVAQCPPSVSRLVEATSEPGSIDGVSDVDRVADQKDRTASCLLR